MTTTRTPAVVLGDAVTFCRGRQHAAEQYARNITPIPQLPGERGILDDLLAERQQLARDEAAMWGRYASLYEERFRNAADAEMAEADRAEQACTCGLTPCRRWRDLSGACAGPILNALGEVVVPRTVPAGHRCTARNCWCRR